jgi:hypothetical protein
MLANNPSPAAEVSVPTAGAPPGSRRDRLLRWGLTLGIGGLAVGAVLFDTLVNGAGWPYLLQRLQTFVTIFLGIFIEAVPFLLIGSVVSGLIAVYVDQGMVDRYLPKQPLFGAAVGGVMGLLFPVCECGVVPVVRRLYEKGLPLSIGIAFLLAAPVVNPVVILSTFSAFGWGPVLWGRIVFTFLIATGVGYLFSRARPEEVLLPEVCAAHEAACCSVHAPAGPKPAPAPGRLAHAFSLAGDDFLDMARYLIVGCMLAASMQTLLPQATLLAVGQGPLISVLALQGLAFLLSVCSTVDAFLALAFAGSFTTGAIVAFLVFGPMVDVKSTIMFLGVFRKKVAVYLILLPFLLSLLMGLAWNLNLGL